MSEQGNFDSSANFTPNDIGLVYPRPSAIHLVVNELEVQKSLVFQEDPDLTPEERVALMGSLKSFIGGRHKLSPSDTSIALIAYEDMRTESLELAATQEISEARANALVWITEYICSGNRPVNSTAQRLVNMKRGAHAN